MFVCPVAVFIGSMLRLICMLCGVLITSSIGFFLWMFEEVGQTFLTLGQQLRYYVSK